MTSDNLYRQWEAERREAQPLPGLLPINAPMINEQTGEVYHTPMSLMRQRILDRMTEKYEGYTFYIEDTASFFDFLNFPHPLYFGSTSWHSPTTKEKWVDARQALDIGLPAPMTAPDLARAYVGLKFPNRRPRMNRDQYAACVDAEFGLPCYADPCALYDGAVYFDLTSAYWQIVRAVGWNVEYMPGSFIGAGESMTDFPFRWQKLTRNCLVSIGIGGKLQYWTGSKIEWKKPGNQYVNRLLWRLTCDVLNGVACDAVNAGARYVNVDGYICSGADSPKVAQAIEAWGLRYGVKYHGDSGAIRGVGSYMVGDYQSIPYRQSIRSGSYNKVYDPNVEWLRWRIKSFAEQADQDWLFFKGIEGYDD